MSVLPALVLAISFVGVMFFMVVLAIHFSTRIAPVATVASTVAMVGTVIWMAWTAFATLSGGPLTVTVPVTPIGLLATEGIEIVPAQATIVSGGLDQATVEVTGLSLPTRVALLLAVLVAGSTLLGVSLVIRRLARSVGESDPFTVSGDALMTTAWIVLIGGLLGSAISDFGIWRASVEVFQITGWSSGDSSISGDVSAADFGWPDPAGFTLNIPFWPLGAGLVLALLAAVFRHGQQLRRDAEGLV